MIKNFIKIAHRNIVKNKFQTVINTSGLAVGIACSLLIMIWVQNELSTDAWHGNNDVLMTIYEKQFSNNKIEMS